MPPYFDFQLYNVFSEKLCLRASSAADNPASCSFKMPMICSSVNRWRFTRDLPQINIMRKSHRADGSVFGGKVNGHATQVFKQFELVFLLHKDGTVDDEFFDARMGLLRRALRMPGNLQWCKEWSHHFYDVRFRRYADKIAGELS